MIRRHSGPSRARAKRWILAAAVAPAVLLAGIGVTSAAFVQELAVTGDAAGSIDIAQGPAEADQYPSPDARNIIATATDPTSALVTTLFVDPTGDPDQATSEIDVTIQAVGQTLESVATIVVTNDGTPAPVWDALLFGLYDQDTPLLPEGIPVTAAELAQAAGVAVPAASTNTSATLTVKVWLAPDAPLEAYASVPAMNFDIVGETVGGQTITGEVVFP